MTPYEAKLTAILYRAFCPDSNELGEYHFEMSPPERAAFIRDHLEECPHCRLELQQLKQFLKVVSSDLDITPIERFKIWVAERLPEIRDPSRPLAFGLRGDATGQYFYQAGEAQITIEIQDDLAAPGSKILLGLVLGLTSAERQVHCVRTGERVKSSAVDELGNFVLAGLEPGEYDLLLQNDELEIQIQNLVIEPGP